ncbi:MAG: hypothetical protein JNN25_00145 [Candidatus Kapabacteria bacterium]|nr:hypothetical protein [Candidatus Kapabacteria bacterium]
MPAQILTLHGFIKDVTYQAHLTNRLEEYDFAHFDINAASTSGVILHEQQQLAFSKWVSPKRTRSYPFERIYNTLNAQKIVTIIPIIKDEGKDGDLDKIQYSTFSWMNLLNVYVVLAFYDSAEKNLAPQQAHRHKITSQRFNAAFVNEQLQEIMHYRQSALHWNRTLLENRFITTFERALASYQQISEATGVSMNPRKSLKSYLASIQADFEQFKKQSLKASESASKREIQTTHKHEFLETATKAKLVIKNYLGGEYFLTADEILLEWHKGQKRLIIQESKNTGQSLLPSVSDIKDGLFKLVLYSNLDSISLAEEKISFATRLYLSGKCNGRITLHTASGQDFTAFFSKNPSLTTAQKELLLTLQKEAQANNLEIVVSSHLGGANGAA